MPTVVRDMGMGCGRGAVVSLISVVIGLPLGLVGVLGTLWLVTAFDFQPWVLVLVAVLWMLPFGIGLAIVYATVKRRSNKLDAMFEPLGLEGGAYLTFFRQYHGLVHGRQADVYLWRGPHLQIEIQTPLATRIGVTGRQTDTLFFAELAGRQPMHLADPDLAALTVFPHDEAWARDLMADRTATDALRRLTAAGSSIFTRQQVFLRPGAFVLMLTGNTKLFGLDITPEQARAWVDDLVRVARAAEAVPAPQVLDNLSTAEEMALRLRTKNPYLALWVGLGTLGFFLVMAIVIFALVFLLT